MQFVERDIANVRAANLDQFSSGMRTARLCFASTQSNRSLSTGTWIDDDENAAKIALVNRGLGSR